MRTQYIIPIILTVNEDLAQGDELDLLLEDVDSLVRNFQLDGARATMARPGKLRTYK